MINMKIDDFLKQLKTIRTVRLNRKGKIIGKIVRFGNRIFYFSYRNDNHYFIKFHGFGLDAGVLKKILEEEVALRKVTSNKRFKLMIMIYYDGKTERKILLADPIQFLMEGIDVHYTKDTEIDWETYGKQKILGEDKMICLMKEKKIKNNNI